MEHKKMYKAGKNWLVGSIALIGMGISLTQLNVQQAHADTTASTNKVADAASTNNGNTQPQQVVYNDPQSSGQGASYTTDGQVSSYVGVTVNEGQSNQATTGTSGAMVDLNQVKTLTESGEVKNESNENRTITANYSFGDGFNLTAAGPVKITQNDLSTGDAGVTYSADGTNFMSYADFTAANSMDKLKTMRVQGILKPTGQFNFSVPLVIPTVSDDDAKSMWSQMNFGSTINDGIRPNNWMVAGNIHFTRQINGFYGVIKDDKGDYVAVPADVQKVLDAAGLTVTGGTRNFVNTFQLPISGTAFLLGDSNVKLDLAKINQALNKIGYVSVLQSDGSQYAEYTLDSYAPRNTQPTLSVENGQSITAIPNDKQYLEVKKVIDTTDQSFIAGPMATYDATKGATAVSPVDGSDVTKALTETGDTVDPKTPGVYTVTYNYAGNGFTVSKDEKVTVTASKAAVTGHDSSIMQGDDWTKGDNFDSVKDADGNPLSLESVTVDGDVDTNQPGSYPVTYSYVDAAGNKMSKKVMVTVMPMNSGKDDNGNKETKPASGTVVAKTQNAGPASLKATPLRMATSAQTDDSVSLPKRNALPETGERNGNIVSLVGLGLTSIAGTLGLLEYRKRH